ncbi:MAG: ShlB/FhaC/HecB family hemolysin secretion/activation protein [Alkalinema sp. RL_2_19]|nr:ShlB/FhaC/HecB family hemolysin secretion/activation protein [Alkalinema sp. RL_2_19]
MSIPRTLAPLVLTFLSIDYPAAQAEISALATLTDRDLPPDITQVASSVLVTNQLIKGERQIGQRLAQRALRLPQSDNAATTFTAVPAPQSVAASLPISTKTAVAPAGTVKAFLQAQDTQLNTIPAETATTIAQNDSPSLLPRTNTRTEVVEEQVDESTQFEVKQIEIVGNTRFPQEELTAYTKPLEGQQIGLAELRKAVDAITQLYISKGYLNSRAFLGNQEVTDGKVTIQILEGSVEEIKVEGNERLPDSYVIDRIRSGVESPLRGDKLEEQLRLLNIDPASMNA